MDTNRKIESLNDADFQEIEELSSVHFELSELAVILGIDYQEFVNEFEKESRLRQTILKGRLLTEYEIRKTTFQLAKQGSPQAISIAEKYIEATRLREELDEYE